MPFESAQARIAAIVKDLAIQNKTELDRLKAEEQHLSRPDFLWHYLLRSFSTMGKSSGFQGLIETPENYNRVAFERLAMLPPAEREHELKETCRAAKIRMPDRKAIFLMACFDRIQQLGGLEAANAALFSAPGRDGKLRFLESFPGIGPKYARNILMDVYHPEFRDSIALDVRIYAISEKLGVKFSSYAEHERWYLDAGKLVGLNGWEMDRILYEHRDTIEPILSGA